MKFKLAISALVIAGTIGVSEAQLVDGQTIGIDFGTTNPTTNDFIQYAFNAGTVAVTKDVTGAAVSGVNVLGSGFSGQNGDAVENGGEDPVFDTSNLEDWIGFPASASITISGLDDSLEYELVIGAGFTNLNGQTIYGADGQSVTPDPLAANPFGTLSNLETDGSGNLVISLNKNVIVVTVSALTLTASTPPAGNTWQLDGSGNWSAPANWSLGVPNGADVSATFDGALPLTGPVTATLDVPVTLGDLALASSQAITIAGPSTLTFDAMVSGEVSATAGSHAISADVALSDPLDVVLAAGSALDVSGVLSGASTVTLKGSGDLLLSGDLSGFTGGLISEGGDLEIPTGNTATDVARMNTKTGGTISISGTVTLAGNASFGVGAGIQGTTGSLTVETGGELNIGEGGAFTGIGGGDVFAQRTQSGNGTLNIAGGTLNVAAPGTNSSGAGGLDATNFWMNPYGTGGGASTVNLDGGLLSTARQIRDGSGGTTIFNFNGGTLQAAATTAGPLLGNLDRVNFRDGGGTIDTQGFDVTYNQNLLHSNIGGDAATDGGLTKLGSGTLTIGGANTYTGPTTVSEGTFGLTGTFTSDVSVADGAGLSGTGSTTGSLTLGGTTGANLMIDAVSPTGVSVGDLTLNGVTQLILPGGSGPFAVATYSGTLTDGNMGTLADSFAVVGGRAPSITDTAGLIEASVSTETTTWTGAISGNWELGGPDANWTSSDTFFFNGDEILFDDSGTNKTVTLLSDVVPAFFDVDNSVGNDYTFQGGFGITGTTGLLKLGDGVLTLLNNNTYTGATTINSGSVTVGGGGTTGSLGSGAVVNDGTLTFNRSDDIVVGNGISGIGTLVKDGGGNLTLNVANTYAGGTTVSDGTLTLGAIGATSTTAPILVQNGGTLTFTNARHDVWGNAATIQTPVITIDTGGVVQSNNSYNGLINLVLNGGTLSANGGANANYPTFGLKGTVTVNATAGGSFISTTGSGGSNTVAIGSPALPAPNFTTFDVADGAAAADLTVSAPLSNNAGGAKGLIKTGAGTMVMNSTNTYGNDTVVEAGVLSLGDGTNNTGLADAADVSVASGAVLDLNYIGTDTINQLTLGGAPVTPGVWGATGSGASNIDDTYFTGTGTLTVNTVTGAYGTWAAANGLSGADADPNADIEDSGTGDGLDNLLEFAFGTDPNISDNTALTVTDGTTFTPGNVRVEVSFSPLEITMQYVRRKDFAAAGLTYTPEFSDSGGGFIPDPADPVAVEVSSQDPGDYEVVEVPFLLFDGGGMKAQSVMGRVAVTLSP